MKAFRLAQLARKLNTGTSTIVDMLSSKGLVIENKPNAKLGGEHLDVLSEIILQGYYLSESNDKIGCSECKKPYQNLFDAKPEKINSSLGDAVKSVLEKFSSINVWSYSSGNQETLEVDSLCFEGLDRLCLEFEEYDRFYSSNDTNFWIEFFKLEEAKKAIKRLLKYICGKTTTSKIVFNIKRYFTRIIVPKLFFSYPDDDEEKREFYARVLSSPYRTIQRHRSFNLISYEKNRTINFSS